MTVPSGNRKPAVLQAAGRAYRAVPGGMLKPTNAEWPLYPGNQARGAYPAVSGVREPRPGTCHTMS